MFESDHESRSDVTRHALDDEALPLADLAWSDGVIGMGFLPHEIGLPRRWTWSGQVPEA
jgi:hypothetical protein